MLSTDRNIKEKDFDDLEFNLPRNWFFEIKTALLKPNVFTLEVSLTVFVL